MADEQRTAGGKPIRSRPQESAELAPTQIGSGGEADYSGAKTVASEAGGVVPSFGRSPFGPAPLPPSQPPEVVGTETVVMEMEPEAPIPLAWLAIVEGPGGKRGKVVTLGPETIVGRTQGDLLLSGDRGVSSQHLKVRLEAKEDSSTSPEPQASGGGRVFVLYDLASTNGTYVGSRQTYRDDSSRVYRRELKDGDYLLVGETTLVFKQVE